MNYRPFIDGLRALAVLSVMIFHLNHAWLPGGFMGVDVFFVISGYLITAGLLCDHQHGQTNILAFYQRRIARIFPLFLCVCLTVLTASYLVYTPQDFASAGANFSASCLSILNVKLVGQGNYFAISPDAQPFLHCWSLSLEEQFYLIFPCLLFLLVRLPRRSALVALGSLASLSFVVCIITTRTQPVWAFYLLPSRAWELLAGSLLALLTARHATPAKSRWNTAGRLGGFLLIFTGLIFVGEGPGFPGFSAALPVAGTMLLILCSDASRGWLATPILVWTGRLSFSLYLWHWPVYSIVDYGFCELGEASRIALKIGLSVLLSVLGFLLVEQPARRLLKKREARPLAFGLVFLCLSLCVPLGLGIRKANYISASQEDVKKGGLVFNDEETKGTLMLMGDSNGSMYAKSLRLFCAQNHLKLIVLSVDGENPLPGSASERNTLWDNSLAAIDQHKPDWIILVCRWDASIGDNTGQLRQAVTVLESKVQQVILLTQPPLLPDSALRASLRRGMRPPFFEYPEKRAQLEQINRQLNGLQSPHCTVINITSHFMAPTGGLRIRDDKGRPLYHDSSHLSDWGARLVLPDLQRVITRLPGNS